MTADLLAGFVALQHAAFLVLEMFLWEKPLGLRVFGQTPQAAKQSAALAMNQGLYNGFLSAGLVWGLVAEPALGEPVLRFFLVCVAVAGVFGAASLRKPRVFLIQGLPALLALALR